MVFGNYRVLKMTPHLDEIVLNRCYAIEERLPLHISFVLESIGQVEVYVCTSIIPCIIIPKKGDLLLVDYDEGIVIVKGKRFGCKCMIDKPSMVYAKLEITPLDDGSYL